MHMADALISPAVGGAMWAATGVTAVCAKKVRDDLDDSKIPLMGVLGAFVFGAQMLNFTIPATGSSGHLGGGLILAILLGPYAAFLVMASVLTVQALFFADGGLLALGGNIFNLGFFPAFIAFRSSTADRRQDPDPRTRISAHRRWRSWPATGRARRRARDGPSGISDLPFTTFLRMMLPIHLGDRSRRRPRDRGSGPLRAAQPELLERVDRTAARRPEAETCAHRALACRGLAGAALSWFASANPDGLEWSIAKVTGGAELESSGAAARGLRPLQEMTAFLPDYGFKSAAGRGRSDCGGAKRPPGWPAVNPARASRVSWVARSYW